MALDVVIHAPMGCDEMFVRSYFNGAVAIHTLRTE